MLPNETHLGPYRIVAPIGAGGMGEVYRAVDTRLGREVAIKVLSRDLSSDPEALRRFEQEARAVGMLNHPNIVAIYDVGTDGGLRYIVSELLEGESLRARLRAGALHARKAADLAVQIARGLAAAHDKGIIHRDLKPENIFITRDGQVKILDFGLVKLMQPMFSTNIDEHAPTLHGTPTEPGRLLGTVGYMAPEQVRGESGDHRSDIFSFGVILYEMISGTPPFRGESPIETLNAILKDEPRDLLEIGARVPPALDRVVHHCLEKRPEERFQSARDLAFGLGAMSGMTSQIISYRPFYRLDFRSLARPGLAVLGVLALLSAAYLAGTHHGRLPPPSFKRLTFRSGSVVSARFAPDGQMMLYGAKWSGAPVGIYSVRPDSPESRDLGYNGADLLSVSSTGQLAIALNRHPIGYLRDSGTLAQVAIGGGAPRPILEEVEAADWAPDGKTIAVVRTVNGRCRLEYPIGHVLYDTVGWLASPRFSRDSRTIAFIDHSYPNDDRGVVAIVTVQDGKHRSITPEYESLEGLAWSPDGAHLYFAGDDRGGPHRRAIVSTDLNGKTSVVTTSAGWLWLHDVARDGRMLVSQQIVRAGIFGILPGEQTERDLSWLDYSVVRDLSADGKTILFSESGEAGGDIFSIYVRGIDGSPPVRLGEGTTESLSPDGKWVLTIPRDQTPPQIVMLPTGPGQPRSLTHDAIAHRNARWFPDGRRILFQGNVAGQAPRLWVQSLDGSAPRAVTPDNVSGTVVTPDGTRVLGKTVDRRFFFFPVAGGKPEPVSALAAGDVPMRFTSDGKALFVASFGRIPAVLTRVDLATGQRTMWREFMPAEAAGLINVGPILPTPDGKTFVYSYTRLLSDLYLIE